MASSDGETTTTSSTTTPSATPAKDGNIFDYYTIAIMAADQLDSPVDNNEMITSFSNPNYALHSADALNSNLPPPPTQFFDNDDANLYENLDPSSKSTGPNSSDSSSTSTKKSRAKYAQIDLSAMGIGLGGSDSPTTELTSDGEACPSSSEADSCVTSPYEDSLSSPLPAEQEKLDKGAPGGFLGYYASLELSAKSRDAKDEEQEDEENEDEEHEDEEGEQTTPETPSSKTEEVKTEGQTNYDKTKVINSPDSNDSGIQADVQPRHVPGPVNDDLYAVVSKTRKDPDDKEEEEKKDEEEDKDDDKDSDDDLIFEILPPGWEKHDDESGPYYWHIKSGTIQRDPPKAPLPHRQLSVSSETSQTSQSEASAAESGDPPSESAAAAAPPPPRPPHQQPDALEEFEGHALKYASESLKNIAKKKSPSSPGEPSVREKTSSSGPSSSSAGSAEAGAAAGMDTPIRFAVRSLGWVRIAEEDLTPERSSKAVNKCIVDLSLGRNDINDVVGRWGDGKDLYMDLDDEHLSLIDPQDMSVLNVQPIHSIRVWGVGRDNGRERDFAYVARDRSTRKHMCHVFRCDTPARQIANTLRDICKRIMMQRQQGLQSSTASLQRMSISRPTNLPNLVKDSGDAGSSAGEKLTFADLYTSASFPTPMEEPKKVIRCHYLGTAHVAKPTDQKASVDILNSAMEKVYARVPPEKWVFTSVAVAPSTITISEHGKADNVLAECRVRFLSFMGIAMRNVKLCSFIMHTAQDQFVAHVFHCEPSAGALCKTIEAACKLRYQKCLDAHQIQMQNVMRQAAAQQNRSTPSTPLSPTATLVASVASATSSASGRLATSFKTGMQSVIGIIKKKTTDFKS